MTANDKDEGIAPTPTPHKHIIFTELDGLEGVLVDLNTKRYYQLNETASLIWRGLEKQLPVSQIATEITERYEVSHEGAVSSIERALREFQTQKLVVQ